MSTGRARGDDRAMALARRATVRGLLVLPLAACAAIPSQRASFRDPTDTARLTRAAAGVTGLEIQGGAADVHIVAGDAESIDVTVALRSQDARRLEEICVPGSRLLAEPHGERVVLMLDQESRDRCGEVWQVRVPAGMPVTVRTNVGKVVASGLSGGLVVRISATGNIDAELAGGPVDVRVEVGDAKVAWRGGATGDVRLRANVGSAELQVAGMRIPVPRHGAGARLESKGQGAHDLRVESNVGDVRLVVGPRG